MKTVIFKTEDAVFEFSRNYVIEHLNKLFKENSSDEINNIIIREIFTTKLFQAAAGQTRMAFRSGHN